MGNVESIARSVEDWVAATGETAHTAFHPVLTDYAVALTDDVLVFENHLALGVDAGIFRRFAQPVTGLSSASETKDRLVATGLKRGEDRFFRSPAVAQPERVLVVAWVKEGR